MIHKYATKKLGRGNAHRDLMIYNLCRSLVLSGKIVTTKQKAKVLQSKMDRLITYAKGNQQMLKKFFCDDTVSTVLIDKYSSGNVDRNSGYTRRYLLNPRTGDKADMAQVTFVD